jgi:hypothetical protein
MRPQTEKSKIMTVKRAGKRYLSKGTSSKRESYGSIFLLG